MGLDILTPKGQESLEHEREAALLLAAARDCLLVSTPKDQPADIDYLIVKAGELVGIAEFKCRNMTMNELKVRFKNEWLLTKDKIDRGVIIAKALRVPFFGVLYFIPDGALMIKKIWDGQELCEMENKITTTSATINGGTMDGLNSFICMDKATIIEK